MLISADEVRARIKEIEMKLNGSWYYEGEGEYGNIIGDMDESYLFVTLYDVPNTY